MDKCNQCEQHLRLIREVQDALIRAGKNTVAGYTGRFAECIDEMAQEIRHLTNQSSGPDNACPNYHARTFGKTKLVDLP